MEGKDKGGLRWEKSIMRSRQDQIFILTRQDYEICRSTG